MSSQNNKNPATHARSSRARKLAWHAAWLLPALLGPTWAVLLGRMHASTTVASVTGFIMVCLLAATSYTDLRWKRIPNWATYSAVLWALAINAFASLTLGPEAIERIRSGLGDCGADPIYTQIAYLGPIGFLQSAAGAGVCFAAMFLVYSFAGGGAGDAKMATAMGAILGVQRGFLVLMWAHVIAGVVVVAWALCRFGWPKLVEICAVYLNVKLPGYGKISGPPSWKWLMHRPVPLAPFFALGTIATLLELALL